MAAVPQSPQQQHRNSLPSVDVKQRQISLPTLPVSQVGSALAPGWMVMNDPNGRQMYFNPSTGQTSWEPPAPQALPPGWQRAQTPDGKAIFIHTASGTVSYTPPAMGSPPAPAPAPQMQVQRTVSVPQVTRVVARKPEMKPEISRAMTAPVAAQSSKAGAVNVSVNMGVPLKAIPGAEQAYKIHQLSENNNVQVLSKKLATDMATTTTTAASLVTRQAKTVGKTMISKSRMQRATKKMVVKTGAVTVNASRACKGVFNEMVDAADGKGKYAAKQQKKFVPYKADGSAIASVSMQLNSSASASTNQAVKPASAPRPLNVAANGSLNLTMNAGVPIRKPVGKPLPMMAQAVNHTPTSPSQIPVQLQSYAPDQKPPIHSLPQNQTGLTSTQLEALQAQQLSPHNFKPTFEPRPSLHHPVNAPRPSQLPNQIQLNVQGAFQANAAIGTSQTQGMVQLPQSPNVLPQAIPSATPFGLPPPTYQQSVHPQPHHTTSQPPTTHTTTQATTSHSGHHDAHSLEQPMIQLNLTGSTDASIQLGTSASHNNNGTHAQHGHASSHGRPTHSTHQNHSSPHHSNPHHASEPHPAQPHHAPEHHDADLHHPQEHNSQESASVQYDLQNSAVPTSNQVEPNQFTIDATGSGQTQMQTMSPDPSTYAQQTINPDPSTCAQQPVLDPMSTAVATSSTQQVPDATVYQQQQYVANQEQVQPIDGISTMSSAPVADPNQLYYDQSAAYSYDYQMAADHTAMAQGDTYAQGYAATTTQTAIDPNTGGEIIYTESAYVDPSSGIAYAQEEIIYVDENGNVLADQQAAAAMYVDESGDVIYEEQETYVEEDGAGGYEVEQEEMYAECEVEGGEECDAGGDFECDF